MTKYRAPGRQNSGSAPLLLPRAFCMWLKTRKFSCLGVFALTFEGESSQNWWYLHGGNTPLACSTGKNLAVRVLRAVRVIGISAFGGETDACRSIYPLPILTPSEPFGTGSVSGRPVQLRSNSSHFSQTTIIDLFERRCRPL